MGKLGGMAGRRADSVDSAARRSSSRRKLRTAGPNTATGARGPDTPAERAGPTPPGTLMEMTTELTAFSSAPVDVAKLNVPDGFKQVEHEMKKALK